MDTKAKVPAGAWIDPFVLTDNIKDTESYFQCQCPCNSVSVSEVTVLNYPVSVSDSVTGGSQVETGAKDPNWRRKVGTPQILAPGMEALD